MNQKSWLRDGFGAIRRRPILLLVEVAWRWTLGLVAGLLVFFSGIEFLGSVRISDSEWLLLHTGNPVLIADVLTGLLTESMPLFLRMLIVLAFGLAFLWIIAATIGRVVVARALMSASGTSGWHAILWINLARLVLCGMALLGYAGALLIAGWIVSFGLENRPWLFLAIFLPLAFLVSITWSAINWFLVVAPLHAVRAGLGAFSAISDALTLFRQRKSEIAGINGWIGIMRVGTFIFALIASLAVLVTGVQLHIAVELILLVLVSLAYFAVADFLYLARLAAYAVLMEDEAAKAAVAGSPAAMLAMSAPV